MTDRHAGYIVSLAQDMRVDDAQAVIAALQMIKGVIDVQPITADYGFAIAEARADSVWRERLHTMLRETRRSSFGL